MGFYLPLMGVVLIDKISTTTKGKRNQLLALTKHPYMVFDPNIVDDRILKFAALVYEKKSSFTFQQVFDDLKPLLMKALESGSCYAFDLLYRFRLLESNTASVEIFLNRLPENTLDEKTAWTLVRCCAEYDKGDLLLSYAHKLKNIITEEYFNLRIPTMRETALYNRLCKEK